MCSYVIRYAVGAWVELPYYAYKTQRYGLAIKCVLSSMAYLGSVHVLYAYKPVQTLWVRGISLTLDCTGTVLGLYWPGLHRSFTIQPNTQCSSTPFSYLTLTKHATTTHYRQFRAFATCVLYTVHYH
eukprot:5319642-Pyramimonas_sp.AAC.1